MLAVAGVIGLAIVRRTASLASLDFRLLSVAIDFGRLTLTDLPGALRVEVYNKTRDSFSAEGAGGTILAPSGSTVGRIEGGPIQIPSSTAVNVNLNFRLYMGAVSDALRAGAENFKVSGYLYTAGGQQLPFTLTMSADGLGVGLSAVDEDVSMAVDVMPINGGEFEVSTLPQPVPPC